MRCKQIQRDLSVRSANARITDPAVAEHLKTCTVCAAFLQRLERLETHVASWDSGLPSLALEQRIASRLIAEIPTRNAPHTTRFSRLEASLFWLREHRIMTRRISRRISWGVAFLVAGIILTVTIQMGRANTTFKRMGQAASRVQSVHLLGWNCELTPAVAESVNDGETVHYVAEAFPRRYEAWIKDGRWRETQDTDITVYEAGRVWKNGALVAGQKRPPLLASFAYRAITGGDPFGKGVAYSTQLLGDAVLDGRTVIKLLVETKDASDADGPASTAERRLFWVDPVTYLPVRMEELRYDRDRWAIDAIVWFDYDQPVADTLFDAARVKAEPHTPIISAKDYYRMTDDQYAKFGEIIKGHQAEQDRLNADPTLSREQKDRQLVQEGAQFMERVGRIMNQDQRRLWNDWNEAQFEMEKKLLTPQQRKEDAAWRAQQEKLVDDWLNTQDERTKQLLRGHTGFSKYSFQ